MQQLILMEKENNPQDIYDDIVSTVMELKWGKDKVGNEEIGAGLVMIAAELRKIRKCLEDKQGE